MIFRVEADGQLGLLTRRAIADYQRGYGFKSSGEPNLTLLEHLEERFAASGHRLRPLLEEIVLSDAFRTTSGPREIEKADGADDD